MRALNILLFCLTEMGLLILLYIAGYLFLQSRFQICKSG